MNLKLDKQTQEIYNLRNKMKEIHGGYVIKVFNEKDEIQFIGTITKNGSVLVSPITWKINNKRKKK